MKNPKKSGNWIFWILHWITLGLVLSLGLAYGSEFVDPGIFWPLAFFGLAYPIIIILNLICMGYWILKGNWRFLLPLLMVLLGFREFSRTISLSFLKPHKQELQKGVIKILTYNVHSFKPLDNRSQEVRKEMLDIIELEKPDILGIQEFYTRKKGEFDLLDSLRKILHHPFYYYHKVDSNPNESTGMAIFSKYPIQNIELMGFDRSQTVNGTIRADIKTPKGLFRLYCVHLQSIDFRPKDYAYFNRVKEKIKPELKPTRRIFEKLKIAFIKRAEQSNQIRSSIEDCPLPVIVLGDFNDTPVSYSYQTILGKLRSSFEACGRGMGRTYNGSFPNFQIDHILCDSNFQITHYKIIEKKLSDHYPVLATILLKRKP